jgi:hypothetical protein
MDEGNEELEVSVKMEMVDDTGLDAASKDGMEGATELQGETGDNEVTPVVKKQSKRGRKSRTPGEKATKQSKASKPQAPNSGGRVLRTRQKGVAGSKDKSQPKKIKLEEPSDESHASESQQQQSSHVETSEDKQESEEAKHDGEASSESKRVLRKRKQPSGAKTSAAADSSSNRTATSKSNNAPESTGSSADPSSKSTPTRQSKRLKVASKPESESMDETGKPTTATEEGSEELIIRVPTSVTMVNDSVADKKSTSEAGGDKTEVPNDEESVSKKSTPSTSTDSNDAGGDQMIVGSSSGGQSGDTGGQEETPPTTRPLDESSSKADPQPSSSSSSSTSTAGDGDGGKQIEGEKDKVEPPKKIDRSDLPPMIKIRAGMFIVGFPPPEVDLPSQEFF